MIGIISSVVPDWINEPLGNPESFAFIPGIFTGLSTGEKMNFYQRLLNTVMGNLIKHQFNYYSDGQNKYVDKYFGPGFPSIHQLTTEFALVFANSHFSLNGVRPFTPSVIEIGGIHIQDNQEELSPVSDCFFYMMQKEC